MGEKRLKSTIYESTLSTADAVPLPRWGRLRGATLRVDFYKGRCPKVVSSHQPPATQNYSSLLSNYGVQRVQKVLRVQRVPVAASPPFWLTVFPYRQPSPRGEGAPKGRIGHWRYERQMMQMEKRFCTSELFTKAPYPPLTRSPFPGGEGLGGATLLLTSRSFSESAIPRQFHVKFADCH